MLVTTKLFATFRNGRFSSDQIDLPDSATLADLLAHLEIPEQDVGILLVNGRDAAPQSRLAENDVVSIFPTLGGG
jgi:sulfur carrier protein ThiS